jgi:hypothetical protein
MFAALENLDENLNISRIWSIIRKHQNLNQKRSMLRIPGFLDFAHGLLFRKAHRYNLGSGFVKIRACFKTA